MKIKRLLSAVIGLVMIIGLIPAMSLTASAASLSDKEYNWYVGLKGGTVEVGDEIFLQGDTYKADLDNSDYGVKCDYTYKISNTSIIDFGGKVSGSTYYADNGGATGTFARTGNVSIEVTLVLKHDRKGTSTYKYTIDYTVLSAARKVYVGVEYTAPANDNVTEYGPAVNSFSADVEGMVEFYKVNKIHRMRFLKPGTVTVTTSYSETEVKGNTLIPHNGSFTTRYNVMAPERVSGGTFSLSSEEFAGGGLFPGFAVDSDYAVVSEAHINKEMTDYYIGDRLPSFAVGTSLYTRVTITPKPGYYFDKNQKYQVQYNGKSYDCYYDAGKTEYDGILYAYFNVTLTKGEVYSLSASGLEKPIHDVTFDTTADVGESCSVTSILYYDEADNRITKAKYGDLIKMKITVECDENHTFREGGKLYWREAKIYSNPGVKVDSKTGYYEIWYSIEATEGQIIRSVSLSVPTPVGGMVVSSKATSNTVGMTTYGDAKWTAFASAVGTATTGFDYDVKIGFTKEDSDYYILPDDFLTSGKVYINGIEAEDVYEDSSNPGVYYAEGCFTAKDYALSMSFLGNECTVSGRCTNQKTNPKGAIYIAFYDASGKFISAKKGASSTTYSPVETAIIPDGAEICKGMYWIDGSIKPKCEEITMQVPPQKLSVSIPNLQYDIEDGQSDQVVVDVNGGKGELTYKWMYRGYAAYSQWEEVLFTGEQGKVFAAGENTDTLTVNASVDTFCDQMEVKCIVTDEYGQIAESNATLIVVNTLPFDGGIERTTLKLAGDGVSQISAYGKYGEGGYTYKWEYYKKEWENVSTGWNAIPSTLSCFEGIDRKTLTVIAGEGMPETFRIRCRVYDKSGAGIRSDECVVTVVEDGYFDVNITANELSVADGETFNISALADGGSAPFTYQWFCNGSGSEAYAQVLEYPDVFIGDIWGETLTGIADKESFPNGIYVKCRAWDDGKTVMSDPIHIVFE